MALPAPWSSQLLLSNSRVCTRDRGTSSGALKEASFPARHGVIKWSLKRSGERCQPRFAGARSLSITSEMPEQEVVESEVEQGDKEEQVVEDVGKIDDPYLSAVEVDAPNMSAEEKVDSPKEVSGVPTAKVKFVLERKCHFGQQFNVVGSTPVLGEWDPAAAIELEWSEGHIWSKEVDVPVGQTVEYKFLLTGKPEELAWQPGSNLSFQTLDTSDLVLTAAGDWTATQAGLEEAVFDTPVEDPDVEAEADTTTTAEAVGDSFADEVAAVAEATNVSTEAKENVESQEESSEVPVVYESLASAVVEVSGEMVEDPAAAEV